MELSPVALKSLVLYAARRLLADGTVPPRRVRVQMTHGRESRVLESAGTADDKPAEELLSAATSAVPAAALARCFLSDDEAAILRAVGGGAVPIDAIRRQAGVGAITRTRLLVANLVRRGVLRIDESGYRIANLAFLKVVAAQTPGQAETG